ncbi:MAG: glycine cleavage system protein GcvH [Deltaproteobacteria bacterium]|nr:glycine cleavage system protein GcvH [Deltaproteobacteria bacterium]
MGNLLFHKEHCWIRSEGDIGTIGISDFAQNQMGQIIYVEIPETGRELAVGEEFGAIESSKTTSDLIAPVSGEVLEANTSLEDDPTLINRSPYDQGWIARIRISQPSELEGLLDEASYLQKVSG